MRTGFLGGGFLRLAVGPRGAGIGRALVASAVTGALVGGGGACGLGDAGALALEYRADSCS